MLTTKDMGVSGANNRQKFPGIGAIVNREVGAAQPGHARLRRRAVRREHRPRPRLLRRPHARRRSTTRSPPAATRTRPTSRCQNLNLAKRPDARAARRPPLAAASTSTTCRRERRPLPTAEAMDRFAHEAYEFVTGPSARQAFDISKEDPRLRDRYGRHSWGQIDAAGPAAGRGRLDVRDGPLRRLGPPLGPEEGLRELPAEGGQRWCRRCSRTWTTAACWTRRWWCCAASSAGRRR